jgi:hypothetical protein
MNVSDTPIKNANNAYLRVDYWMRFPAQTINYKIGSQRITINTIEYCLVLNVNIIRLEYSVAEN